MLQSSVIKTIQTEDSSPTGAETPSFNVIGKKCPFMHSHSPSMIACPQIESLVNKPMITTQVEDQVEEDSSPETFGKTGTEMSPTSIQDKEDLLDALREFDRKKLGFIPSSDLRLILSFLDSDMREDDIESMIKIADVNENGRIDYHVIVEVFGKP